MTGLPLATMLRTVFPDNESTPHFDSVERLLRAIPNDSVEEFLEDRVTTILNKHPIRGDRRNPKTGAPPSIPSRSQGLSSLRQTAQTLVLEAEIGPGHGGLYPNGPAFH